MASSAPAASAATIALVGDMTPDVAAPAAPETTFSIRGGPMGALDEDAARHLASHILSGERTHFTAAALGTWAHSGKSLKVLGDALVACQGMERVDIADIVAGRMEAEALEAFAAIAGALEPLRGKLKAVNLSSNAVGHRGLEPLRGLLTEQEALEELVMKACGVSAKSQELITGMLLFRGAAPDDEPVPDALATRLRVITFDNNMAGDAGGVAMARLVRHSPHLVDMQMTASRVGAEGGKALAAAVASVPRPTLRRLSFQDNPFGPASAPLLAAALTPAAAPALEEIDLRDTMLRDEGAAAVLRALLGADPASADLPASVPAAAAARPLRVIRLDGVDILQDGQAARLLGTAVAALPALTTLTASLNDLNCAVSHITAGLRARAAAGLPPLALVDVGTNFTHPRFLGDLVRAAAETGVARLEIGGNMAEEATLEAWRAEAAGRTDVSVESGEMEPEDPEGEAEASETYDPPASLPMMAPQDAADALADRLGAVAIE